MLDYMKRLLGFFLGLVLTFAVVLVPAQEGDGPNGEPKKKGFLKKENKKGGTSEARCKKKVAWTVNAQTETSLAATFETECELGDVIVWPTPSLAKYVSVSPDSFSVGEGGGSYSITLSVEQPAAITEPGGEEKTTIAGTLHIRHDGRPPRTFGKPLQVKFKDDNGEETVAQVAAVVGAADFQAGPIAPGQIVSVFGSGLGPRELVTLRVDSSGKLANYLGDTQVLFDGVPAPVVHAREDQVSVIVPFDVVGKSAVEMIVTHLAQISREIQLPVVSAAPALFTIDASGEGQGAILNQDLALNSVENPAPRGSVISLFATGGGLWRGGNVDGEIFNDTLPSLQLPVSVEIGGVKVPVRYAGGASGLVNGAVQINVELTFDVPAGERVPITLAVGEESSKAVVTVAVL